jgi:hypothetical protein
MKNNLKKLLTLRSRNDILIKSPASDSDCSLKTKQIIRQQKMISVEIYTSQRFNFKS